MKWSHEHDDKSLGWTRSRASPAWTDKRSTTFSDRGTPSVARATFVGRCSPSSWPVVFMAASVPDAACSRGWDGPRASGVVRPPSAVELPSSGRETGQSIPSTSPCLVPSDLGDCAGAGRSGRLRRDGPAARVQAATVDLSISSRFSAGTLPTQRASSGGRRGTASSSPTTRAALSVWPTARCRCGDRSMTASWLARSWFGRPSSKPSSAERALR